MAPAGYEGAAAGAQGCTERELVLNVAAAMQGTDGRMGTLSHDVLRENCGVISRTFGAAIPASVWFTESFKSADEMPASGFRVMTDGRNTAPLRMLMRLPAPMCIAAMKFALSPDLDRSKLRGVLQSMFGGGALPLAPMNMTAVAPSAPRDAVPWVEELGAGGFCGVYAMGDANDALAVVGIDGGELFREYIAAAIRAQAALKMGDMCCSTEICRMRDAMCRAARRCLCRIASIASGMDFVCSEPDALAACAAESPAARPAIDLDATNQSTDLLTLRGRPELAIPALLNFTNVFESCPCGCCNCCLASGVCETPCYCYYSGVTPKCSALRAVVVADGDIAAGIRLVPVDIISDCEPNWIGWSAGPLTAHQSVAREADDGIPRFKALVCVRGSDIVRDKTATAGATTLPV